MKCHEIKITYPLDLVVGGTKLLSAQLDLPSPPSGLTAYSEQKEYDAVSAEQSGIRWVCESTELVLS